MFRRVVSIALVIVMVIGLMPVMQVQADGEFGNTISAGGSHSMVIKEDGSLWAWGSNEYGQLGDGTDKEKLTPIKIMNGVMSVYTGYRHTLAIMTDRSLWGWGDKVDETEGSLVPIKIADNVTSVSIGGFDGVVLKTDGSLWSLGNNWWDSYPIKLMDEVADVSVGGSHCMAIKSDGSLWAWGSNEYGQLGDGTNEERLDPIKIMDDVDSVSAGHFFSIAIKTDGSLWAWGNNSWGMLNDRDVVHKLTPVKIMDRVVSASAKVRDIMAIRADGSLWAWGDNEYGQLGDGTLEYKEKPIKIMDNVTSVSTGYYHTMAIKNDGSLWTWGNNEDGQLGDGTKEEKLTSVKIMDAMATANVASSEYDYDISDPGESMVLPTNDLLSVTDETTAISAIDNATSNMTAEQKVSPTGVDRIILYAEEATAQAASKTVASGDILINQENLQELQSVALSTRNVAERALSNAGITTAREMSAGVKFKTAQINNVSITVDPSAIKTIVDNVKVETPEYTIAFSKGAIASDAGDSPLIVTITEVDTDIAEIHYPLLTASASDRIFYGLEQGLTVMAASGVTTYKIGFNKPVKENIKVSLPPVTGDSNYQAVMRSDGTAVGGKYNPATGKLDVKIRDGGMYTVRENRKDFSDIQNKSNEMQQAIKVMASKGIINGTSATTFGPDGTITRAEIAALIVRTLSKLDPNANGGFTDVKSKDWYFGAVGSAKKFGIINGTSATTFAPMSNIQKDQIVAVSARTLRTEMKYKNPSDVEKWLGGYTDRSDIPGWGNTDIALATRENLVVKRTDGKFLPAGTMTRGDAAIILYRMFMKIW